MARYSSEHKASSHQKIVKTAAEFFKRYGYKATRVDAVMKAAGLTSGSFYAHFESKEDLFRQALQTAAHKPRELFKQGLDKQTPVEKLHTLARRYLSKAHLNAKDQETSCPFPSLVSELDQSSPETKRAIEAEFLQSVEVVAQAIPAGPGISRKERAMATLALFVGTLSLARSLHDPKVIEKLLRAGHHLAAPEFYQGKTKGEENEKI